MKSLLQSINEGLVSEAVKISNLLTADLMDVYDAFREGGEEDAEEVFKNLEISGSDKKEYLKLIETLEALGAEMEITEIGDMYYKDDGFDNLHDWLVEYGHIEDRYNGIIIKREGDNEMSLVISYVKNPNSSQKKIIDAFVEAVNKCPAVIFVDTF